MITQPIPILFLHAFPLDARMWRPQVEALRGVRVIAPDLRGFGRNRRTPLFESVDQHAKDVVAMLDQASVVRVLVVGLSMGGYVAFALARLFPHRVAGFVFANTRAEPDSDVERAKRDAMIEQVQQVGTSLLPNVMLPGLVTSSCGDDVRNQLRGMMLEQDAQGVLAGIRALRGRPDARGTFSQIHCPVAVVGGACDVLSPPRFQQTIADGIPGAELVVIPGVGHLTNLEAPGAFNRVVMETHERARRYVVRGGGRG